jgi:large subunit ribosomal protein L5
MPKEIKDLKTRFKKEIAPKLQKDLGVKNMLAVPKLSKVTINVGTGSILQGSKDSSAIVENIARITGQAPVVTKARQAISNFKIREDQPIGVAVTLRGARMYDFVNKLVNVVFPRVRDFRGISPKSFDGQGNYTVGLKEHVVFPEIDSDDIEKIHGLQITVATTAKNNEEGKALLTAIGFPFKKI